MKQVTQLAELRQWRFHELEHVVLVPTMGALHEGHLSLIRHARQVAGPLGKVVVSIFVNPLQFGVNEDLTRYPQPFSKDAFLCEQEGVDLLFHPSAEEMYPFQASIKIEETDLSLDFCGASRPGHFAGVLTVVTKLFHLIAPQTALFGEKDWQQLALLRRLVHDLNFPIEILSHPIVREPDGLALSSRNAYLSREERSIAPLIYQALLATAAHVHAGEHEVMPLLMTLRIALQAIPNTSLDYAEIVDGTTLQKLMLLKAGTRARLLVAVKLGNTRLLDNIELVAS